jgi:ureidoglycolate hydrolase
MEEIKAIPLDAEEFKSYGQIISASHGKPLADEEEFIYWGKVSELVMGERISTGVLICRNRARIVSKLERHVLTPEILVAVSGDSLICVAKPSSGDGGEPIEGIQVFRIRQGDAFVMAAGTWHWIPFPADREQAKYLVIFASGTEDEDLEVRELDAPISIGG